MDGNRIPTLSLILLSHALTPSQKHLSPLPICIKATVLRHVNMPLLEAWGNERPVIVANDTPPRVQRNRSVLVGNMVGASWPFGVAVTL